MRESDIISELRAALRRRGVWGARAERLLQEWTEHVRDDAAQRVENGAGPEAAQEAAWRALGRANVLAASAACQLARASWLGRHPWLGGAALPVFLWLAAMIAIIVVPGLILMGIGNLPAMRDARFPDAVFVCWQQVFNWLPWLLCLAWLARIGTRMPGGWKLYWITAMVLTIFPNLVQMGVNPQLSVPHARYAICFGGFPFGILGAAYHGLFHLLDLFPAFDAWIDLWPEPRMRLVPSQAAQWIQPALMMLAAITFHRKAAYGREARHA